MMRFGHFAALLLLAGTAPLRADPPSDKPLAGERLGGEEQDLRATKRIDTRQPSRLDTRLKPRTIWRPLGAATSPITADAGSDCVRDLGQPLASPAQPCEAPQ